MILRIVDNLSSISLKTGWIKLPGGPTGKFQVNTLITCTMIHSQGLWNQISKQLFSNLQASNY